MTGVTARRLLVRRPGTALLGLLAVLGGAVLVGAEPAPPPVQPASFVLPSDNNDLDQARAREAQTLAALEGSNAVVQAAGISLAQVSAQLPGAERAVSVARGELAGAQAKATAAQAAAVRAEQARAAAQQQVDAATGQVERTREDVGRMARRAYQRGRLGDLRDVMDSTDPQNALERRDLLESVFRAGTTSVDRLTRDRLTLASTTAQLAQQQKAAAAAREQAAAEQGRASRVAADAQAAAGRVVALQTQRQAALQTAEGQRAQDRKQYEVAQAESQALAEQIRRLAAEAAARLAAQEAAARAAAQAAAAQAAAAQAAAAQAAQASRARPAAPGAPAPQAPAAPPPAVSSGSGWLWPVSGPITSLFGWRTNPIYGDRRFHAGIDIAASTGTPIAATRDGVVLFAGWSGGYGNLVVIGHAGNVASAYAHQSQILVSPGQFVSRGQTIGLVGSTGNSTGPHLHFEIRENGNPVDPLGYASPS